MNQTSSTESKQPENQSPQLGDLVEFKLCGKTYIERVIMIQAEDQDMTKKVQYVVERPGNSQIKLERHEILKIHPRKSAAQEISRLREMANNLQDLYDDISYGSKPYQLFKHDVLACCNEILKQANLIKDRVF